jgi:hypothetical protein
MSEEVDAMNQSSIRYLAVGWIGTMGWVNLSQAGVSDVPGPAPQITVYVYNWPQVEPNSLREAKEVVTRIFRKAGVDATLLDASPTSSEVKGKEPQPLGQTNFFVQILTLPMAESLKLSTEVLGVAPGNPQELNRDQVYVLEAVAERMAQEQVKARETHAVFLNASKGQILGHGMAHEIGHVLLHQAGHSPAGLMRSQWTRTDFENMVGGNLRFTPKEAERVRAEVRRRNAMKIGLDPGR